MLGGKGGPIGGQMTTLERASAAAATLEEELLRLLARQARRMPVPVFLSALMIAGLAYGYVPVPFLAAWLGLVVVVLAVRWRVLGRLALPAAASSAERLRAAIALSAVNGMTHGLSLAFFPFLPEFERALQSMLLIAFCAGSVATTSGYMPLLLAYLVPVLGPLTLLWAASPGVADKGWIEYSTAALAALLGVILVGLGRDAWRLFRESFEIRLQQAELNRQLAAALEQAEAANRAKTRFLASASHDLRQPIHTLSLFGGALSMRPLDPTTRDIAAHINTALEALTTQLDALLDISKLDAGVMRVSRAPVDLRSFLERLKAGFEPAARGKRLELRLDCPPGAVAHTDPALLERIVRNLLDNAVKYTDLGYVALDVQSGNGAHVLTVADSGRGIREADQARVFEEFYQVDNPERDRTKGLGLGLAIVKRLAGLLDIGLELVSAPGHGTLFRLTLPAAPGEPAPAAEAGLRPGAGGGRRGGDPPGHAHAPRGDGLPRRARRRNRARARGGARRAARPGAGRFPPARERQWHRHGAGAARALPGPAGDPRERRHRRGPAAGGGAGGHHAAPQAGAARDAEARHCGGYRALGEGR
jgi:signal transduction histidine kinase